MWLACPYFDAQVELTVERTRHVGRRHRDVRVEEIAGVLQDPDIVLLRPWSMDERLLVRVVDDPGRGSHIVVVVICDEPASDTELARRWIVSAYRSPALPMGVEEWRKS